MELVGFPSNSGEAARVQLTLLPLLLLPEDMINQVIMRKRRVVGIPSLKASLIYALTDFQTQTMVAHNRCGIRVAALWARP